MNGNLFLNSFCRFDLGGGPATIRSEDKITLKQLHKVTATRSNQDGRLQVDNGVVVSDSSPGSLKYLNLNQPLYAGYVPDMPER